MDSINSDRLAEIFASLVEIDSVSREEGRVCEWIRRRLDMLGCATFIDAAGAKVGGNCGNLIAHWQGNRQAAPLLLSSHMDTVEPGRGIKALFKDGVFTSAGDTILGADDKSAIAIVLEVLQCIRDHNLPCGPLELVFTVCEEVGLLGAKNLDFSRLRAKMGYALDTRNPEAIVTRAPAANRLIFHVHGRAAHAGASPEKGINAIYLAGQAIARMTLGRIDAETTCNIGVIEGGLATNIVPEHVVVKGEARSHDPAKLRMVSAAMVGAFEQVVAEHRGNGSATVPRVAIEVIEDFPRLAIDADHRMIVAARKAAANLGMRMDAVASGGGSDANVFAEHGIATGVLGTGMENVHTVNESIRLSDMLRSARLLLEIIRLHAEQGEGALR